MPDLPGRSGSCWTASSKPTRYPSQSGSIHVETVIVGGGIVGLTAALRLCEAGHPVILLEGLRIGGQVTGRSTAKITTQHALIYHHLMVHFGAKIARAYAEANSAGADQIKRWIESCSIQCNLETKSAYAYSCEAARRGDLAAEAETAGELGLKAELLDKAPLPFETAAALRFPDQAQFNPAMYLTGLAEAVSRHGGRIFEQSRALFIGEASRWRVVTKGGTVHAENVVVATNIPVKSPVGMANRTQPRSHAVMAFRVNDPRLIEGMFISIDEPVRSLRMGSDPEGPLLVALGHKFNTGQEGDVAGRFRELEDWARSRFRLGEVAWHWCNEDYDTVDRVPYAGPPDPKKSPGFHIATGFNAWGITNGTAAGMMIADLICGRDSPWQELYNPLRPVPEDFHQSGDSQSIVADLGHIKPGEGGVVVSGDKRTAAWRDEMGELHFLSAVCTHKGCTVTWNNAERTWDCPCHGSMFTRDGSVLHGPARLPLSKAEP